MGIFGNKRKNSKEPEMPSERIVGEAKRAKPSNTPKKQIPKPRSPKGLGLNVSSRRKPKTNSDMDFGRADSEGLVYSRPELDKGFEEHLNAKGSSFSTTSLPEPDRKTTYAPSPFSTGKEGEEESKLGEMQDILGELQDERLGGRTLKKGSKFRGIKVSEEMKEKNKKYSNLTFKMYSYKIFNWALQGNIDKRSPNLNNNELQIGYSTVFTKKTCTRYFIVHSLPEDAPYALYNYLKNSMRELQFWNKLHVQLLNNKFSGDLRSPSMQMKVSSWTNQIDNDLPDVEENFIEGLDGTKYVKDHIKSEQLKFLQRMLRSYLKVVGHVTHTNETVMVLKIQTLSEEHILMAEDKILTFLDNMNSDYKPVTGSVLDFLRSFSLVSKGNTLARRNVEKMLMTNGDLAGVTPIRQGKVGRFGLFFGIDIMSGLMVWLDLLGTSEAKNIYVTGRTGSGKSFFLSVMLFFIRALKIRCFIEDYKGTEFRNFTISNRGIIISQTPRKMTYINKWVIPTELAESDEELLGMFTEMVGRIQQEFMIIISPTEDKRKDVEQIFMEFMKFVHSKLSIDKTDPRTYYKTKDINPQMLYDTYCTYIGPQNAHVEQMFSKKLLTSIQIDLEMYWSRSGARSELYLNPVNLEDMCRNSIVTYDFGTQENDMTSTPLKEEKLKKMNYEAARAIYVAYNKKHKMTTVVVKEEVQSADPELLEITSNSITQGRSSNVINIVLGNSTGVLFQQDNPVAAKIRENFTVLVVGKVTDDAIELLTKQYGLQKVKHLMHSIADDPAMARCFLVHSMITGQEVTAVTSMILPSDVAESDYFRTVDHEGNQDVELKEERYQLN